MKIWSIFGSHILFPLTAKLCWSCYSLFLPSSLCYFHIGVVFYVDSEFKVKLRCSCIGSWGGRRQSDLIDFLSTFLTHRLYRCSSLSPFPHMLRQLFNRCQLTVSMICMLYSLTQMPQASAISCIFSCALS